MYVKEEAYGTENYGASEEIEKQSAPDAASP